jgi:hypothetical protein
LAENVAITAGSGTTVATDEVTINSVAVQVQRVKVALGTDNNYQADLANGQATMANSLPVAIASNQSAVPASVADGSNTVEGALADAIVAAGASGSLSAKLRRVTQGLEDLKTLIVLAAGSATIGNVTRNGLGSQVGSDITLSWTLNQASGTSVNSGDLTNPTTLQPDALYKVSVYNPSTQTALTMIAQNKETLASSARYCELARWSVAANSSADVIVQGLFVAEAGRIAASNDTGGTLTAFSATVRIRKL